MRLIALVLILLALLQAARWLEKLFEFEASLDDWEQRRLAGNGV